MKGIKMSKIINFFILASGWIFLIFFKKYLEALICFVAIMSIASVVQEIKGDLNGKEQ